MTTLREPEAGDATAQRIRAQLARAFDLRDGSADHDALVAAYIAGSWAFPATALSLLPASTEAAEKRQRLTAWLSAVPQQYRTVLAGALRSNVTYLNMVGGQLYVERD